MDIADEIFKQKSYDAEKLKKFGFAGTKNGFEIGVPVMDGEFKLLVKIGKNGVSSDVIEVATGDAFALYHVEQANGAFVQKIKNAAEKILRDIAKNCFFTEVFRSTQAKMVIDYARERYGNPTEFLWEKFPDCAIIRRADNRKWYVAILTVERKKLGLDGAGTLEIVDLRELPDALPALIDGKKYFAGYHMNKRHWFTICLDGSATDADLRERIDRSYAIAGTKK